VSVASLSGSAVRTVNRNKIKLFACPVFCTYRSSFPSSIINCGWKVLIQVLRLLWQVLVRWRSAGFHTIVKDGAASICRMVEL